MKSDNRIDTIDEIREAGDTRSGVKKWKLTVNEQGINFIHYLWNQLTHINNDDVMKIVQSQK